MSLEILIDNPEIYARSIPIEWHLSNEPEKHNDRMTRLARNVKKVITRGGIVDAVITNEKKILLGDRDLSWLCKENGLPFAIFTAERKDRRSNTPVTTKDDISISGLDKFDARHINELLNTNYNDNQIQLLQKIIYERVVEIILHKMAEAE